MINKRDGFSNIDFQQKCDNKGSSLTILQSTEGYIFGAFSSLSFSSFLYVYQTEPSSFLFSLSNPHSSILPPTRFFIKPGEGKRVCGRWTNNTQSMMVGWGEDLKLAGNPNLNFSHFSFPSSFVDSAGLGNKTFTGNESFKLLEMEVFNLK